MLVGELTTTAATLISRLPPDAFSLSADHLEALGELEHRITEALAGAGAQIEAMVEHASERGAPSEAQPVRYLTAEESGEWEKVQSAALDAERASQALNGWLERAGWHDVARNLGLGVGGSGPRELAVAASRR
jgi:hypothetical protein